jgi:tetratricopeptide (TPR) repeat protein
MSGGIVLYERALMYNAKHADALYNLGVACGETGQVSRAIFLYELAIHFNPSCAEAWNNLGVLQRDMGNFESGSSSLVQTEPFTLPHMLSAYHAHSLSSGY